MIVSKMNQRFLVKNKTSIDPEKSEPSGFAAKLLFIVCKCFWPFAVHSWFELVFFTTIIKTNFKHG